MVVSVQNLSMHYTGEDLFTSINFLVREKDRIGLVGKNGAGKTTLLRLIAGLIQPHKGEIIIPDGVTIGYLPQEMALNSRVTVLEEALTAFDEIKRMHQRVEAITALLHQRTDYESVEYHRLVSELSLLNERLALMEAFSLEGQAEQVLLGLGFSHDDMRRQMQTFSNGWQMRVELAKILLKKPSLVLLDEPTNHLDIESIQWLESFLNGYYGAVVLVSHDRAFLDAVTNRTIEIVAGRIYDYKAAYSAYLELRQQRIETQTAAYENQQREIREIERFIERFRYKASKARQVQSRVKMLERMEDIGIDDMEQARMRLRFPPAPHSGRVVMEIKGLRKQYGSLVVLDNLEMTLMRGEKVAFVGRNGEGKTTLAKIMAGVLPYEAGEVRPGHLVSIGYYAQNQHEMLDGDKTVFETLDDVAVGPVRTQLKNILGAFLFSGDAIEKKVKVLSGGEKARLSLARLLLTPVNLLILDEPTNHLDMASKDILKSALLQFEGTVVVVSHDRDFLMGLTEKVFEFKKPVIREYLGDVYDYLEARNIATLEALNAASAPKGTKQQEVSAGKVHYEQRKSAARERRKIEREVAQLEDRIHQLESEISQMDKALAEPLAHPEVSSQAWFERYAELKAQLDIAMSEWELKVAELEE
ncbi:MAG: ABC-F family ATP-binding cassette domain-containing protein [Bacteroidetes bacterium]|nr:ABC-F family ATP-binding cassette domain-containing protein [Bacteroidota bacterium]